MAATGLPKQTIPLTFSNGLNTKVDPKQIPLGQFDSMENVIFDEDGLLKKRNGFGLLTTISGTEYLTTFRGNLTSLGTSIYAYSAGNNSSVNKGTFQPISLSVQPVVRSALSQTQCDSVVAPNDFVCTVYTESNNGTLSYKYVIQDSTTGQNIISPAVIPVGSGVVTGSPRVFLLGGYFVIVFTNVIAAVSHLQYVTISISNPSTITANTDIAPTYVSATTLSWDGVVSGTKLYLAYNLTAGGQAVRVTYLNTSFQVATPVSFAGSIATIMSICADETTAGSPIIYAAFYDSAGSTGYMVAVDQNLNKVMTATQIIATGTYRNLTCTAQSGVCTAVLEKAAAYAYDANIATNFLQKVAVTKPLTLTTGTVGSTTTVLRSVGLASKGFLMNGVMYMLATYDGKSTVYAALQPTYFLIDSSGRVIGRLAYENGGGYLTVGLPKAQVLDDTVYVAYLFKDLVIPVNKSQGATSAVGVYSQTGVNLGSWGFNSDTLSTSELGQNLNVSGGMLFCYDGNTFNEQNFNLYPDVDLTPDGSGTSKSLTVSNAGGSMTTQNYYYVLLYEWTDAQGNIFRSAPSIPIAAASASFTGSSNSVTVNFPTLRITYKTGVKLIAYRWSTAQQTYYQVTSVLAPTLNSTSADVVQFVDTQADSAIIGNSILYTTGGVIENTNAPACTAITTWDTRLWMINAEDENELLYSKPGQKSVPVEMNNSQTYFVDPNAGTNENTGPMRCIAPMDDKLIILKSNALFYINGTGPNILGTGSQYSQPIFITSSVGSVNQRSLRMIPEGLMFESNKGIWILKRDLSTEYIGAPVERYNGDAVNSAEDIPGTTQVRFTLESGIHLVYDYYYKRWGTFRGIPAIASTVFEGLHTVVNSDGQISQETPEVYLDNGNPVLMQFTTGWINPTGVQGYQRSYMLYFLGQYFTPHKLVWGVAYNYNSAPTQLQIITPTNFSPNYGTGDESTPYGQQQEYGGTGDAEQWRIFFNRQRCMAFQISMQETFDSSFGYPAGAGLTLSSLLLVIGQKKGYRPISAAKSAGGSQ
jgi:hypothetical protein